MTPPWQERCGAGCVPQGPSGQVLSITSGHDGIMVCPSCSLWWSSPAHCWSVAGTKAHHAQFSFAFSSWPWFITLGLSALLPSYAEQSWDSPVSFHTLILLTAGECRFCMHAQLFIHFTLYISSLWIVSAFVCVFTCSVQNHYNLS